MSVFRMRVSGSLIDVLRSSQELTKEDYLQVRDPGDVCVPNRNGISRTFRFGASNGDT